MIFDNSKWITKAWNKYNGRSIDPPLPLVRKTFTLEKSVKSAVLNICGLGFGVYYINGMRVTDDVLTTPYTKYDATILYQTYDITDKLSRHNALCVSLGNGMYSNKSDIWNFEKASWRSQPKLIANLVIEFDNGETMEINTDSSWKCCDGPITFSQVRSGETFDARLEPAGWKEVEFDDSAWDNASICPGGGGILKPIGNMPPIRICKTITPQKLNDKVYDFGVNLSGWCKIITECEAGREIRIDFSERVTEDGDIDPEFINLGNGSVAPHRDIYITRDGKQEWEPAFIYHGFRYVKVENAPENFEIYAREVHNDLQSVGFFECSDEMLNKLHDACRRTIINNWHSFPQDCPHREQNGWTGDAWLSSETSLFNFDMPEAYRKWLRDFKDVQRPDGLIPSIIPTSTWGYLYTWHKYNFGGGPSFDSALIQIPYNIYLYTGDTSIIMEMWENMDRYFNYISTVSDNYIVDYGLGDWLPAEGAIKCPAGVVETACYYLDAIHMGKMADAIGKCSWEYYQVGKKIKKAFRERFIKDGIVESGGQTAMSFAIALGLYEQSEIPNAVTYLNELIKSNGWHFDCGFYGTKYVITALCENGYCDTVYKMMTNPTIPSPAVWIKSGLTTISEYWGMDNSYFHPARTSIDTWFYKYLAGICVYGNHVVIKPQFIDAIDWVKASYRNISVEWNKEELKVTLPFEADIVIKGENIHKSAGEWVFKL